MTGHKKLKGGRRGGVWESMGRLRGLERSTCPGSPPHPRGSQLVPFWLSAALPVTEQHVDTHTHWIIWNVKGDSNAGCQVRRAPPVFFPLFFCLSDVHVFYLKSFFFLLRQSTFVVGLLCWTRAAKWKATIYSRISSLWDTAFCFQPTNVLSIFFCRTYLSTK